MNAVATVARRPLADLLGARWLARARTCGVAWSAAPDMAAFGLSDGSLALAWRTWKGAPTARPRAGGGVELVPAEAAAPPLARIPVHDGPCRALAADPDRGFLTSGTDGQVCRSQEDGIIDTLARLAPLPVDLLASGRGGWRVYAVGREVIRLGGAKIVLAETPAALAVAPNGARVAIGHRGGVKIWAGGATPRVFSGAGADVHGALAWRPDGGGLASATDTGDVFVWDLPTGAARLIEEGRGTARPLAFTADGERLVFGATGAVACHDLATGAAVSCGIAGRDAVVALAAHPSRPLIAAGYANGAILIVRPGTTEVVFIRDAGGGGVDALAWSPDGASLAFGVAGGDIGLVALPGILFRDAGGVAR